MKCTISILANMEETKPPLQQENKFDHHLFCIIIIAILVFILEAYLVSKVRFIGITDPARFANVAENLIKGNGFQLDTIGNYFFQYSGITHPEEYSFPLISIAIVPFLLIFGKTALAVKLPQLISGVILIPIITYFLGNELFDRRIGFLAAISMIFLPLTFTANFFGQRDPLFTVFVLLSFYFFIKGFNYEKNFYLAGVFLGLSYLAKPTAILIFGVFFIAQCILQRKISKIFLKWMLPAVLIVAPWFIRNFILFGNPLFSASSFDSYLLGYVGMYEPAEYAVYWNSVKPSFLWLLGQLGPNHFVQSIVYKILGELTDQAHSMIYLMIPAYIGLFFRKVRNKKIKILTFAIIFSFLVLNFTGNYIGKTGLPRIYFFSLFSLAYLSLLGVSFFYFREEEKINSTFFVTLWGVFALFASIFWVFDVRFFLPFIPLLLIYSWFGINSLLQKVVESTKLEKPNLDKITIVILVIIVLISLPYTFGNFFHKNATYPYKDDNRSLSIMQMGNKIGTSTEKDAVIMGCYVESMRFYSGKKYLQMPNEEMHTIVSIMKKYNVSYLTLYGCERRINVDKLYQLSTGKTPPEGVGYKLYKITNIEVDNFSLSEI